MPPRPSGFHFLTSWNSFMMPAVLFLFLRTFPMTILELFTRRYFATLFSRNPRTEQDLHHPQPLKAQYLLECWCDDDINAILLTYISWTFILFIPSCKTILSWKLFDDIHWQQTNWSEKQRLDHIWVFLVFSQTLHLSLEYLVRSDISQRCGNSVVLCSSR